MRCVTNGAGTANPSGAPEFTPGFVLSFFFFYSLYCLSFFELRILIIPKEIFKFFLQVFVNNSGIKLYHFKILQTQNTKDGKIRPQSGVFVETGQGKVKRQARVSPATTKATIIHIIKLDRSTGIRTSIRSQIFNSKNSPVFFPRVKSNSRNGINSTTDLIGKKKKKVLYFLPTKKY